MVTIVNIADGDRNWGAKMRGNLDALNNGVETVRTLATGKYAKPSSGIPASDLAAAVQANLGDVTNGGRLGLTGKNISGANLNALTDNGFYAGNNLTNSPDGSNGFFYVLVQQNRDADNYFMQTATKYARGGDSGDTFRRFSEGAGVYTSWVRIADKSGASDGVLRYILGATERISPRGKDITATDMNSAVDSGFYTGKTLGNAPLGLTGYFFVFVKGYSADTNWVEQTATEFADANGNASATRRTWVRQCQGGTWSSWTLVSDSTGAVDATARTTANAAVKKVNGTSPDGSGNVVIPIPTNANTLVADSSTTTDAANAFLAQGGYRAIRGTLTLTKALVIPSHTQLDATGALIKGATTDNIITNAAAVPARTATGSSTAGSTTLTGSGSNFSASDVGRQVELIGAGPNNNSNAPGSWYATIVSVTNSTTAVLSVPANLTTSGKTLYIYPARDRDISIFGGEWQPGDKNAISQTQQSHGFRFRRVDIISVNSIFMRGPGNQKVGGQYSHSYGDVTQVNTWDLHFEDTNSDGIHFQGPAKGISIRDVQGYNTGDDLVAFTGVDGQSVTGSLLGDTEGDVVDVHVDGIYGYGVWTHLKITGGTGPGGTLRTVSKFVAENIYGYSNTGGPVNIVDYAGTTTFSGRIANVYAVGASGAQPQVVSSASNVLSLHVDGVFWPATNGIPNTGVVVLNGTIRKAVVENVSFASTAGAGTDLSPAVYVGSSSISYLEVDNTTASDSNVQNFMAVQVASALVCTLLSITNHYSQSVTGNALYFTGSNWAIDTIVFDKVSRKAGSWIDGTGTSANNSTIQATNCTGGNAWILLRQPATVNISNCTQLGASGAGIRLIGTNASIVATVAGSNRNTTLLSKDGTQNVRVVDCTCIGVDATLVNVFSSGDLFRANNSLYLRSGSAWKTL